MTDARNLWLGAALWLGGVAVVRPDPFDVAWAKALIVLAPLVLVPMAFDLAERFGAMPHWWRVARMLRLPAALALAIGFMSDQGPIAAAFAAPWLLTTFLVAAAAGWRLWSRGLVMSPELCVDAGMVFLAVGGCWAFTDRLGARPLQFSGVIVLLTAAHFHYAGFLLPILTGLAMRRCPGRFADLAGTLVLVGVPCVAAGITATQLGLPTGLESSAAVTMAAGTLLSAGLHLRLATDPDAPSIVRRLWLLAGSALLATMLLAAMYGCRFFLPVAWLDIPRMRVLHGTANALAFGGGGTLAWWLLLRRTEQPQT